MTDKPPRRSGGDGDEPAETPTERLLREAMGARAAQVTAHSLRPAAPPKSRIRRLRPVYTVAVPFGLAAAMAVGVLTFHGEPVAHDQVPPPAATLTTSPSPTAEPTATPTPTPSATPTDTGTATPDDPEPEVPLSDPTPSSSATTTNAAPPAGPSTPYTFRGVKLKVPAGWRPVSDGAFRLCLLSPGAPQDAGFPDCRPYGAELAVFDADSPVWPTIGDLDSGSGWGQQPYCPIWGNPHVPGGEAVNSTGPTKSTPTISGRPGLKSQWQVTCGGSPFTGQIWALPKDQVFISAIGLKNTYQAGLQSIVNSLDVSGHAAPPRADVSVTGLKPGQQVPNYDIAVPFSVTFKNTGSTKITGARALVFPDDYSGSPSGEVGGTLERREGAEWKSTGLLLLSNGRATPEKGLPVDLDPGQSVTVDYRLTLYPMDGPGTLPLNAQLILPDSGSDSGSDSGKTVGRTTLMVQVVAK
ncbi:hypothetical protein ACFZDG_30750 [Kitasatospora xanthocidica]|uniref:hypothetical protein n=1 Tax=Kitasatospora xanthocidica TaxID=83382 RepID=UPI0036E37C8C